jgi:hypothetical protein
VFNGKTSPSIALFPPQRLHTCKVSDTAFFQNPDTSVKSNLAAFIFPQQYLLRRFTIKVAGHK